MMEDQEMAHADMIDYDQMIYKEREILISYAYLKRTLQSKVVWYSISRDFFKTQNSRCIHIPKSRLPPSTTTDFFLPA